MKLHYTNPVIRKHLLDGQFGLEKESLRVDASNGEFATTLHPFNHPRIVQDFAENQTEINTGVHDTWQEARAECEELTRYMLVRLKDMNETLWPFSNPPKLHSLEDIPMLQSGLPASIAYRHYLAERYGKRKMVYSGIHYNFSFTEALLKKEYELYKQEGKSFESFRLFRDRFYLDLAQKTVWYGWLIDLLLNASPLYDGSLFDESTCGQTRFCSRSSMRNSDQGFWNIFTPYFSYEDMQAYTSSIDRYVQEGLLKAPRELYYPVRIKPSSAYSLEALNEFGATHMELRMIDLNPYELSGISEVDAQFCHLFLVFLACMDDFTLSIKDQIYAIANFKNACRLPIEQGRILFDVDTSSDARSEGISFLDDMEAFYAKIHVKEAKACIEAQKAKLLDPKQNLLARRVQRDFSDFASDGLRQALRLQNQVLPGNRSDKISLCRSDAFQ